MKKLAAVLIAVAAAAVPVMADTPVNVVVNGIPAPEKGVIVDSRTMVPVRGVTEQLGFDVAWDADTKTATFTKDVLVIKMTAGEKSFYVNELPITPDVPQAIINDRFMLPLRAMCETIGADVDWDGDTKTANIKVSAEGLPSLPEIDHSAVPGLSKPDEKPDEKPAEKPDDNKNEIDTGIPGVSIEIVDPSEVTDIVTDIEL